MMDKLYRCGYCGSPCSEEGEPLKMSQIGLIKDMSQWDTADSVHGECCRGQAESLEREYRQVTREMAMDAGDPSLEGHQF